MNHEENQRIDALIAEKVMGWIDIRVENIRNVGTLAIARGPTTPILMGQPPSGNRDAVPAYSTDISAAMQMEAEIDTLATFNGKVVKHNEAVPGGFSTRGSPLRRRYALALLRITSPNDDEREVTTSGYDGRIGGPFTIDRIWRLLHATPRQRCEAALSSLGISVEEKKS